MATITHRLRESLALCVFAGATLLTTTTAYATDANLGASLTATSQDFVFGSGDYLQSANNNYKALWQGGDFAVDRLNFTRRLWSSWTSGYSAQVLTFQSNGNLMITADAEVEDGYWDYQYNYDYGYWEDVWIVTGSHIENQVVWQTGTWGHPGAQLVMQDDSNLAIYDASGNYLWGTGRRDPRSWGNVLGDRISYNTIMKANDCLLSQDERYLAIFQGDGNFVVYRTWDMCGRWASNTENRGANMCVLQGDGNLVIYRTWEVPNGSWGYQYNEETGEDEWVFFPTGGTHTEYYCLWHTNTPGNANDWLVMQNDSNLVLYTWYGYGLWNTGIRY